MNSLLGFHRITTHLGSELLLTAPELLLHVRTLILLRSISHAHEWLLLLLLLMLLWEPTSATSELLLLRLPGTELVLLLELLRSHQRVLTVRIQSACWRSEETTSSRAWNSGGCLTRLASKDRTNCLLLLVLGRKKRWNLLLIEMPLSEETTSRETVNLLRLTVNLCK